ncbi:MAG: demethoxyubiquinone hydroxylase family protein [Pseudomonadota bacterium]|nr:demethoxyubiquinone hydroxylase family protein [Pseudomonadota bacterium]
MKQHKRLPGDLTNEQLVQRMIRVDHAGEYGAARIYDGQLRVLQDTPSASIIRKMSDQEQKHLDYFNALVIERKVRPTILSPLWHIAGYGLGMASAALGEKAAMTCTVAVESIIDEHYQGQIDQLRGSEPDLREKLSEFRNDEIEHRNTASNYTDANNAGLKVLENMVRSATRTAIWLSERF